MVIVAVAAVYVVRLVGAQGPTVTEEQFAELENGASFGGYDATFTETPFAVWDFGDSPPASCVDVTQNELLHAKKRYVDNTGELYVERFDTTANSAEYVKQWQTCAIALSEQDGRKPSTASGTTNGVHWTADPSAGYFQYGNVVTLVRYENPTVKGTERLALATKDLVNQLAR